MAAEPKDSRADIALYKDLAIVLYRIAKFDDDAPDTRDWAEAQQDFTKRGRRLGKALDRHGYTLVKADPPPNS